MSALLGLLAGYGLLCTALALYGVWPRRSGPVTGDAVVVVLGGGARPGALLASGRARVAAGVAARGVGQGLHFTGGVHDGSSEADLMRAEALARGTAADGITCEGDSRTTLQNALLSASILRGRRIVLVTDRFHAGRAATIFALLGLRVVAVRPSAHRFARRRVIWFFAREGLSFLLNMGRLAAWGLTGLLGVPRAWRLRHLT